MDKNNLQKIVSFFYEIGSLRKIARAHQQALMSQDLSDNIASHSFRTALIGYFLAEELKADSGKVMKMCLIHDIEETRCGDQNWIHKKYVKVFEEEIRKEQLLNIPNSKELQKISEEYQERKTLEAKIAKDADMLDQNLLLREYQLQGNKEAEKWLKTKGVSDEREKLISTDLARQMSKEIKTQNPSLWWSSLWTPKRRKK